MLYFILIGGVFFCFSFLEDIAFVLILSSCDSASKVSELIFKFSFSYARLKRSVERV